MKVDTTKNTNTDEMANVKLKSERINEMRAIRDKNNYDCACVRCSKTYCSHEKQKNIGGLR